MAERGARRVRRFALGLVVVAAGACGREDGEARLVDRACRSGRCVTSGSARQVSGITSDSVGFRLGPGPGKIVIPLPTFTSQGNNSFHVELLAAGSARLKTRLTQETCDSSGSGCSIAEVDTASNFLEREYRWHSAGTFVGKQSAGFAGFTLEVELDQAGDAEIADIRYDRFDAISCAVRAPGAR